MIATTKSQAFLYFTHIGTNIIYYASKYFLFGSVCFLRGFREEKHTIYMEVLYFAVKTELFITAIYIKSEK